MDATIISSLTCLTGVYILLHIQCEEGHGLPEHPHVLQGPLPDSRIAEAINMDNIKTYHYKLETGLGAQDSTLNLNYYCYHLT